jgi:hypothetical protein
MSMHACVCVCVCVCVYVFVCLSSSTSFSLYFSVSLFLFLSPSSPRLPTHHPPQIQMTNVGNIPAVYKLQPLASQFASSFTLTPSEAMLEPSEIAVITMRFKASILGEIDEDFLFDVEGVPAPLRLRVCGRVVGPKMHFDTEGINFGIVAFGFVASHTLTLINDCDVSALFVADVIVVVVVAAVCLCLCLCVCVPGPDIPLIFSAAAPPHHGRVAHLRLAGCCGPQPSPAQRLQLCR